MRAQFISWLPMGFITDNNIKHSNNKNDYLPNKSFVDNKFDYLKSWY